MKGLLLSGLFVSIGLFIGRIAGFLREAYIASKFGASEQTDLIIVFLSTPDILVNLLIGGALGMALIPEFKSLPSHHSQALYKQVFMLLLVVFTLLAGIGAFYSPQILKLFAPGITELSIHTYSKYFSLTFIAIPLTVAAGVTTAYLHSSNKFFIASLGTLIFNLTVIASLYVSSYFHNENLLLIISFGICIAAFCRWLSQGLNSRVMPFTLLRISNNLVTNDLLRRYLYCVLTGGIIFLVPVIARAIGSQAGAGELSLINYAIKLVEFPLGVLLTVFSIVFFPLFSELYAKKDEQEFLKIFKNVLLTVVIISIAVFIPLSHFSSAIAHLIYDWGQLSQEQLEKITNYLGLVSLTLPFQGVNALLIAVLAARKDTKSPLIWSSFLVIVFIIIGYGFISEVSSVFSLMIGVYSALSFILLMILVFQHKMSFLNHQDFLVALLKVLTLSLIYHFLLVQINFTQAVWLEISFATISAIVFLLISTLMCRNQISNIRIRKKS